MCAERVPQEEEGQDSRNHDLKQDQEPGSRRRDRAHARDVQHERREGRDQAEIGNPQPTAPVRRKGPPDEKQRDRREERGRRQDPRGQGHIISAAVHHPLRADDVERPHTPATNTSTSPTNCPPVRDAGSSFVATTTTPKVLMRMPLTFRRVIASRKKSTIRTGMITTFTLTKRAVLDAVVSRIPSFCSSNPTALIAPRTQTRGSRNIRRSRRRVAASTASPRSAPKAIRANVRKSGSTMPTVSLLPGNDVH